MKIFILLISYFFVIQSGHSVDGGISDGGGCIVIHSDGSTTLLNRYLYPNQDNEFFGESADVISLTASMKTLGLGFVDITKLRSYQVALNRVKRWLVNESDYLAKDLLGALETIRMNTLVTPYFFNVVPKRCRKFNDQLGQNEKMDIAALYESKFGILITPSQFNKFSFGEQVEFWVHEAARTIQSQDNTPDDDLMRLPGVVIYGSPYEKTLLEQFSMGELYQNQLKQIDHIKEMNMKFCMRVISSPFRPNFLSNCLKGLTHDELLNILSLFYNQLERLETRVERNELRALIRRGHLELDRYALFNLNYSLDSNAKVANASLALERVVTDVNIKMMLKFLDGYNPFDVRIYLSADQSQLLSEVRKVQRSFSQLKKDGIIK